MEKTKGKTQLYNDERKLRLIKEIQTVGREVIRKSGNRKFTATDWQGKKLK